MSKTLDSVQGEGAAAHAGGSGQGAGRLHGRNTRRTRHADGRVYGQEKIINKKQKDPSFLDILYIIVCWERGALVWCSPCGSDPEKLCFFYIYGVVKAFHTTHPLLVSRTPYYLLDFLSDLLKFEPQAAYPPFSLL